MRFEKGFVWCFEGGAAGCTGQARPGRFAEMNSAIEHGPSPSNTLHLISEFCSTSHGLDQTHSAADERTVSCAEMP